LVLLWFLLKYSQHETKSTVRPIIARDSQIFSLHLKSEENRWKKSPIFGSVNGDETKPYPRRLFNVNFTRV
jgi:hypothetical protein